MGIKEKMMESMIGNMSKEEKMDMMDKMMDSFFSNMTDEEKQEMMTNMMPKMMQNMMGGKKGSMMGMMRNMMGSDDDSEGDGFNPMDMCKEMMSNMRQNSKIAIMGTPEIQGLFEEWVEQIENEILEFIQGKETYGVEEIADNFKISKESAYYFLTKLAQKDKIKLQIKE